MVNNLKSEPRCTPFRRRDSSSSPQRPISAQCGETGAEIGLLVFGMTGFVKCRAGKISRGHEHVQALSGGERQFVRGIAYAD
jgi:hypothetical protein